MKIIEMDKNEKKINIKKLTIVVSITIMILIGAILFIIYCANEEFRNLVDKYVLMKNVVEDGTATISIDEDESNYIFAYDKYISILNKNILSNYNSLGNLDSELDVEITTPIVATNGKYLVIAEKNQSKIYLISGSQKIWEKELEGNIEELTVNKNGYVAVILSGTTSSKSVIQTFDTSGNELFKVYLGKTIAIDADISLDNMYLAFAEINTSGTAIQSTIKIVSIQKNEIINTFSAESGSLVTDIKYQDGNRLICMYDDSIHEIKNEQDEEIVKLSEDGNKITFGGINLTNYTFRILENSSLLNTESSVEITNVASKKTSTYTLKGATKEVNSYNSIIAINLGSEVHFISTNGWLLKKYTSNQEINKIVLNNNFAGIVYRSKIEIVDF